MAAPVRSIPIRAADLLDAWLHTAEPGVGGRPALAARATAGWVELTYAALDRSSRRVAAWLATRGVQRGDGVAIMGEPGIEWTTALFGVWRRGAVAVPLDPRLGAGELGAIIDRSRPVAMIGSGRQAGTAVLGFDEIADLSDGDGVDVERRSGDAALVVWTSGTSGTPKGVTLSLAGIAYVVDQGRRAHRLDDDDRWLSILPLNHVLELSCGLLPALAGGATFAFAGTTAISEVVAAMAERRVTRMTVVPRVLTAVLHGRLDVGGATFHCGGAPLDPAVARGLALRGVPVYTGYGLTETAGPVAMNTPAANRVGAVGRPLPGTEVRIAAERGSGEILVRSPGLMLGYCDDEILTATVVDGAGWFHTGDLGHLDADGFLHVTGRAKSLIVLATGKKVQPEEVERVLTTSTVLTEACVVGRDNLVAAVVVVAPAVRARYPSGPSLHRVAETEVVRLTEGLASFKRPRLVTVVDELPRTAKRSIRRDEVLRLLDARCGG